MTFNLRFYGFESCIDVEKFPFEFETRERATIWCEIPMMSLALKTITKNEADKIAPTIYCTSSNDEHRIQREREREIHAQNIVAIAWIFTKFILSFLLYDAKLSPIICICRKTDHIIVSASN